MSLLADEDRREMERVGRRIADAFELATAPHVIPNDAGGVIYIDTVEKAQAYKRAGLRYDHWTGRMMWS